MSDARLIELETRLAYQEQSIESLSDTVARQQRQLEALEALCRQLIERVQATGDGTQRASAVEEVPPHW